MDTNTKVEEKSEVKAKGGRDVKKRPEAKKPGKVAESAPEGRGRAKSTLVNPFNNKKTPAGKKDVKPVETIGQDRFKNLLSMFEKPDKDKENKEDTGPKKLDMSRFSAFSKTNESTASNDVNSGDNKGSVSEGIQKRMQALLNNNKPGAANNKGLDPVLEQRKKMREDQEESNDSKDFDDDDDDEDDFNDHLSDDKDGEAKDDLDDSFSDSSEKPKKEEKDDSEDEEKDEEKDRSVEEKADESDKDQDENENEDIKSQHSEHIEKENVTRLKEDDKEIISSTQEVEKAENKTSAQVEAKTEAEKADNKTSAEVEAKTEAQTIPQTEHNEEKTTQDA